MATTVAVLIAKLSADTKQFDRAMKSSEGRMQKTGKVAGIVGLAIAGGILYGAKRAISAASSQDEAINKATVTFGRSADEILGWSKTTAQAMGIARTQSLSAAAGFGALFQEAGQAPPVAAQFSKAMVKAAADLGSFHDVDPTEVLESLRSGLAGEAEPLRRFNIFMSEATIKAFAYKNGIAEAGAELTENQKILARQGFILGHIGKAQNDFAETATSAANQQRIQTAVSEDLTATLGRSLLPTWRMVQAVLISVTGWMAEHQRVTKVLIISIAALSAALLAFSVASKLGASSLVRFLFVTRTATGATRAQAAAQWLLNAALIANPIGIVIAALVALGIALVVAYKKSETFRNIVSASIDFVKRHWQLLLLAFGPLPVLIATAVKHFGTLRAKATAAIDAIAGPIIRVIGWVRTFVGWIQTAISALARLGSAIRAIPTPHIPHIPGVPNIPGIPGFQYGGAVPGPLGAPRFVLAHGGETILPTHRPGWRGAGATINFYAPNYLGREETLMDSFRRMVSDYERRNGRSPF